MSDVPRITAMRPTKRDPDRVAIHVAGRFAAALSTRSATELGLAVGRPCDAAMLRRIEQTATVDKAVKQSLSRLGRRMLSRGQLDRKLRELGHDETVRDAALDRVTRAGLVDDRAFAEALIRQVKRSRPAGTRLLRQKLREKLVDPEVIDAVLAEQRDPDADAEAATALAQQRAAQLRRLDPTARRRRIYGLLARRGFDPDAITAAIQRLDFSDPP